MRPGDVIGDRGEILVNRTKCRRCDTPLLAIRTANGVTKLVDLTLERHSHPDTRSWSLSAGGWPRRLSIVIVGTLGLLGCLEVLTQ